MEFNPFERLLTLARADEASPVARMVLGLYAGRGVLHARQRISRMAIASAIIDIRADVTEHVYRYAGNEIAEQRLIPLAWPGPVWHYIGYDRCAGPFHEVEFPEGSSEWDFAEVELRIPVLRPEAT